MNSWNVSRLKAAVRSAETIEDLRWVLIDMLEALEEA